jgi:hypothetical protein
LPEHVLEVLAGIDPDVSRAVVALAQTERAMQPHASAELTAFGRHAVIVLRPSRTLERRTGIVFVPLADGRALISFEEATTIPELELRLQDLADDPELASADKQLVAAIVTLLRDARRSSAVSVQRRNIIVFETGPPPRNRGRRAGLPRRPSADAPLSGNPKQ